MKGFHMEVLEFKDSKLELGKVKSYGAGRVYVNTLICLLIFASNKNYVTLFSDRITDICGCKNVNTALREIDKFVKLGFIERIGDKPIKSRVTTHYYWVYKRIKPESQIVAYNHEVIDNFNKGCAVRTGKVEKIEYINFGKEIALRARLLVKKRSTVSSERKNAEICERLVDSGLFDEALEFINEYSAENPTLECNSWLAGGQLRFSNNVCNTNSSFKQRCKEVYDLDNGAIDLKSYDANASIVRTAHYLTHDTPEDFNVDIYGILMRNLCKKYGFNDSEDIENLLNNSSFRKNFKRAVSPVFMRDYAIHHFAMVCKLVRNWYKEEANRDGGMTCEDYFRINHFHYDDSYIGCFKVVTSLLHTITGLVDPCFEDYYNFYSEYRDVLHSYCHSDWFRKNIFIWESLHHIFIMKKLTELGYKVYNVYDEELVVGGLPDGLYESVWMECAEKTKAIYKEWVALEQERQYSEEKVQKQIERTMARQDKHIQKINEIMVKHPRWNYNTAKNYYLVRNKNVYMKGFLFCEKRVPKSNVNENVEEVERPKLSARKILLMGF